MYRKEDIDRLFDRESIFVVRNYVVPSERAKRIFGDVAVDFAEHIGTDCHNGYGIGDYTMSYLTKTGFYMAATYSNIREYESEEKALKEAATS